MVVLVFLHRFMYLVLFLTDGQILVINHDSYAPLVFEGDTKKLE